MAVIFESSNSRYSKRICRLRERASCRRVPDHELRTGREADRAMSSYEAGMAPSNAIRAELREEASDYLARVDAVATNGNHAKRRPALTYVTHALRLLDPVSPSGRFGGSRAGPGTDYEILQYFLIMYTILTAWTLTE